MLEKRLAMHDRDRIVATLGLASSLGLLTLVLVASIRLPAFATVRSRPDCLRSNFSLSTGQPASCLGATMDTGAVRKLKALPSENEEEEEGAEALSSLGFPSKAFVPSARFPSAS